MIDEGMLLARLAGIADPASGAPIAQSGRIESLEIRGGLVRLVLRAGREDLAAMQEVRDRAEAALRALPGITNATVILAGHRAAPPPTASPPPAPPGAARGHAPIHHAGGEPAAAPERPLASVGAVIAVASGKGGVGKSTTAVNLAVAMARRGLAVGLLDADIHGPSLPRMLGVARPPARDGGMMLPIEAWGLRVMSIGFLVAERTPMIWRGPMVMGALGQLMGEVAWGALDVLVVDMPPGTGDAQLTMAQKGSLAGAVIVSTPQDIALLDVRRGVAMFEKTQVPVLGIVENMSFFCCPACGTRTDLFGHGGAEAEADTLGVPFLGAVPLLLDIRKSGDAGTPIVAAQPDSEAALAYGRVADGVLRSLRRR